MRITKLSLRNWGPHEKLELEMDSPFFGLLGENGSGKTNVLEAIDFCFTGVTERTQETYARRFQGASSNGSAELTFNKDGLIGKIFRQVGTSPRRWMEWDGTKYTKTSDIDRILQEILDCDKKAVSMAVFLSQGHIGDFLFTTDSVREALFSKLCLVDHLSSVADIASQKIQDLQRTVTDLTSVRDEALSAQQSALDTLRAEEHELTLHPDQTTVLGWLNTCIQRMGALATVEAALQRQHGTLQSVRLQAGQRQRPTFLIASMTPAEMLKSEQEKLYTFDTANQQLQDTRNKLTKVRADRANLTSLTQQHNGLREEATRLDGLRDSTSKLGAEILKAKLYLQQVAAQATRQGNLAMAEGSVKEVQEELAKIPELPVIDLLEVHAKQEMDELMPQGLGLKLAQQVEGKVKGACCPLCKSTDLSQLPTGEVLQKQVDAFKEKHTTLTANLALYNTQRARREFLDQRWKNTMVALETARAEMAALPMLPEPSATILDYNQLNAAEAQLRTDERVVTEIMAHAPLMQNLGNRIAELITELTATESEEVLSAKILQLEGSLQGWDVVQSTIAQLKTYIAGVEADEKEIEKASTEVTRLEQEVAQARAASAEGLNYVPAGLTPPPDTFAAQAELSARQQRQQLRVQQEGKITACAEAFRRAEGRVKEVDDRIQGNARTREVINQLEQIKEAFSRSGIPRHYLTQIFEALVEGTQENLANWDSDFQVERDETKLFNFRFYRANDPESLFDQSQLSGGQKMRLSISFLLAVQQLVMPELGFIVLDEPTYGLDDPGIEGLAALFRHMSVHLADVNSQVIVVTHDHLLKSSLSKSVELKSVLEQQ